MKITCLTGFKLTIFNCFPIAEKIPAERDNVPENGIDMAVKTFPPSEHAYQLNTHSHNTYRAQTKEMFSTLAGCM